MDYFCAYHLNAAAKAGLVQLRGFSSSPEERFVFTTLLSVQKALAAILCRCSTGSRVTSATVFTHIKRSRAAPALLELPSGRDGITDSAPQAADRKNASGHLGASTVQPEWQQIVFFAIGEKVGALRTPAPHLRSPSAGSRPGEHHRLGHQVGEGVRWDSNRLLLPLPRMHRSVPDFWAVLAHGEIARELQRGPLGEHAGSPRLGGDALGGVQCSGRLREPALAC
ncbi:unnamed protein product [Arctogadus glacialis]